MRVPGWARRDEVQVLRDGAPQATALKDTYLDLGEYLPGQTIGITDVKVVYHRPAINGRTIWGQLVPYN